MRHHGNIRKFGREKTQRHALLRSLARNLIRDGRIKTTAAKAKELRPFVEKLVTKARTDTVASRRLLSSRVHGAAEIKKLFNDHSAEVYKDGTGGYTRIVRCLAASMTASPMSLIEFV